MKPFRIPIYFVISSSLFLSACGGSDSDSSSSTLVPSEGPIWVQGQFIEDSRFAAQCETPRVGIDPQTGRTYPDLLGSAFDEKMWMRSWSNNTYLWYDEVVDRDPAGFTVANYFEQLKTNELDANGAAKDNFHFQMPTVDWQAQSQSGTQLGYGMEFKIVAATPPRKIVVAYTEPDSPAALASVVRGEEIIAINGVDAVSTIDGAEINVLNSALFPSDDSQSYTFTLKEVGSTATRNVVLTPQAVTSSPVHNVKTIQTTSGKVGYFQFNSHIATAELALKNAFDTLQAENVDDLVLDVRYNGGGLLAIASQLSYMVAGDQQTSNKIFETTSFNDKHPTVNPVTGQTLQPFPFIDEGIGFSLTERTPLPSLNLNRIFILSTDNTCSASEAIINGLRGIDVEVILIGGTTCGKPYGFYPTDNCGTTYFTIQFQGQNHKEFGDYASGFSPMTMPVTEGVRVPGCAVADDFSHKLGDPAEHMLASALQYRIDTTCPSPTGAKAFISRSAQQNTSDANLALEDRRAQTKINSNRLVYLPNK
ncbi:S41 family peptidase [Shewanella gelidii]|uniref:Peptidase S41 n=1 Tax=Shewanella gelidii TaxID=1642821 RepID=A0A917JT64_9GAMM|nr:S41 family peptidase [Shewanella gelidii]MCL1098003.1 S41 family peptidase [Shewanella gelidii]GGI85351.1 peptidase S41 [Shewanella gelidii]